MNNLRYIGIFLFLLTVVGCCYWEVASFSHSLKWDMLDCYFPWRYAASESIIHGAFPFWNPYQHLGYPIHADMRSVFYPETFFIALLFGGYSLKTLHFLFVFYIALAGLGMYRLSELFVKNQWAKLAAAIAYVLSGYFVGHGQEMFGIIAATWIPWVLYYFMLFQQSLSWNHFWKLLFFLFLQLTGGYQALSLILAYLLVLLGLLEVFSKYRSEGISGLMPLIRKNLVLLGGLVLSLAVLAAVYIQVTPHVSRLTSLSLEEVHFGALTSQSLLSFIAPFSVATDPYFLGTDVSMANVYVGMITLALFLTGLFFPKDKRLTLILLFGAACLLAALGPELPVREFLFRYFPGMNLFRMSSFFSYFSQLGFILVAAYGLDQLISRSFSDTKRLTYSSLLMLLVTLGVAVATILDKASGPDLLSSLLHNPTFSYSELSYHQRLLMHSVIQAGILGVFLVFAFLVRKNPRRLGPTVVLFIILEMGISVRLNIDATVIGQVSPVVGQKRIDQQPKGFPIPSLEQPLRSNAQNKPKLSPLYHNLNTFTKTTTVEGFNSFQLARFSQFEQSENLSESLEHPLVYSTDPTASIEIDEYESNRIVCTVSSDHQNQLVLQQVYYPGWETLVDGRSVPTELQYETFPTAKLESGHHLVEFRYQNRHVIIGFIISAIAFMLILLAVLFHSFKQQLGFRSSVLGSGITVTLLVALMGFKWSKASSMETLRNIEYANLVSELQKFNLTDTKVFLQVDKPSLMDSLLNMQKTETEVILTDPRACVGMSRFSREFRGDTNSKTLVYAGSILPENPVIQELLESELKLVESKQFGRTFIHVFEKAAEKSILFRSSIDFEREVENSIPDTLTKAHSGLFDHVISPQQNGSPPIAFRVGDLTSEKRVKILFGLWMRVPIEKPGRSNMWVNVYRNGKEIWSEVQIINDCSIESGEWFETMMLAQPDVDLLPDDEVKAFVWGISEGELRIDDMWLTASVAD